MNAATTHSKRINCPARARTDAARSGLICSIRAIRKLAAPNPKTSRSRKHLSESMRSNISTRAAISPTKTYIDAGGRGRALLMAPQCQATSSAEMQRNTVAVFLLRAAQYREWAARKPPGRLTVLPRRTAGCKRCGRPSRCRGPTSWLRLNKIPAVL